MKKTIILFLSIIFINISIIQAQNDTMYIMKSGNIIGWYKVAEVDSIIFYKPSFPSILIPAGAFTMGSPLTEVNHEIDEVEHQVTISAFRMSKYEITNAQFATFLNLKGVGSSGICSTGNYQSQPLIFPSTGSYDFGLHFNGLQWVPVATYENNPVTNVTWYGAAEFANFAGGRLPTEAEWEYACRANTTTPFNTGVCLNFTQANYTWIYPYNTCTNNITNSPAKTQVVDSYTSNAFGLNNMHGNVWEWVSDWYGAYPTTPQTNPTGPTSGTYKILRGGSFGDYARFCRSAFHLNFYPNNTQYNIGFRVVFAP